MSATLPQDDDWMALQYALGELPADAAASFEESLVDHPDRCLAIARAVQLIAAVQACPPELPLNVPTRPATSSRSRISAHWISIVASLAVTVLIAVGASRLTSSQVFIQQPVPTEVTEGFDADAVEALNLVRLWRHESTAPAISAQASTANIDDVDVAEGSSDDAVPRWLIAAVSIDARDVDPDSRRSSGTPLDTPNVWEEN